MGHPDALLNGGTRIWNWARGWRLPEQVEQGRPRLMPHHVIIDGNNVLYAMHEHAPVPAVGRTKLVRVVENWASKRRGKVTIVFDGAPPDGAEGKRMSTSHLSIRFSAPLIADDVIVMMCEEASDPGGTRVVTDDRAVAKAAKRYRCKHISSVDFVDEIFADEIARPEPVPETPPDAKPASAESTDDWLNIFGMGGEGEDTVLPPGWPDVPTLDHIEEDVDDDELIDTIPDEVPEGFEDKTTDEWLKDFGYDPKDRPESDGFTDRLG